MIGVILGDKGGRLLQANDAYLKIVGYTREDLKAGKVRWDSLMPPDQQPVLADIGRKLGTTGVVEPLETVHLHKEGRRVPVLIGLARLEGPEEQAIGFVLDLSIRKRALEMQRQLSSQLLHLQDEERRRIARELHDSTAQGLAALAMNLTVVGGSKVKLDPHVRRSLAESIRLSKQCSKEIRTLSYLLHPPLLDEVGLVSALRWYVHGFEKRSGVKLRLGMPRNLGHLPAEIELALYRIVQEGLANIQFHSGSKMGSIRLKLGSGRITLTIGDKGHGFSLKAAAILGGDYSGIGVGIRGMRERLRELGGILHIDSNRRGTTLIADVPYK